MINNFFLNAEAYSTFAAQFLLGIVPSNRKCDGALFNRVGGHTRFRRLICSVVDPRCLFNSLL